MWIHWWSSVASAKLLTRAWSTSNHSLGPRRTPTCSWSFSLRSDIPIPPTTASVARHPARTLAASRLVPQRHPTVDDKGLARDPGGVVTEQERRCLGGVRRDTESLHPVGRGDVVLAALVEGAGERRLHHSRCDGVDADGRSELHRQ